MKPKDFRKFCGLSQSELAEKYGISVQAVRNKESGKTNYSPEEMIILKYLVKEKGIENITIDQIFLMKSDEKLNLTTCGQISGGKENEI